jgi:hypothetical protein
MHDLLEKVQWLIENDEEACRIGKRGRDFALALRYNEETLASSAAIAAAIQENRLRSALR